MNALLLASMIFLSPIVLILLVCVWHIIMLDEVDGDYRDWVLEDLKKTAWMGLIPMFNILMVVIIYGIIFYCIVNAFFDMLAGKGFWKSFYRKSFRLLCNENVV